MEFLGTISKTAEWTLFVSKAKHSISQQSKTMPQPVTLKKLKLNGSMKIYQDLLELTPKKDIFFIIGDWNAKVGSQETPGETGKFDLGIWNEAGQRLIEFCQENAQVIANTLFQQHKRRLYTWTSPDGQHRNQIDYILCSQKWRSCIQSQQKQDQVLTVAQIMNSLLQNWDWNWRKLRKPLDHSVWSESNPFWLYSGSEK